MAGILKKNYPGCKIYFLGRTYTRDVIALSRFVDEFINYDEIEKLDQPQQALSLKQHGADIFLHVFPKKEIAFLARKAGIPLRVGTTNRIYHWLTCNKLIRLSRKKSSLHESQLNLRLLEFLNIQTNIPLGEMHAYYGFTRLPDLKEELKTLVDRSKFNLILHPRSKGSAKEWGLENFSKLIKLLPKDRFKVFISGTAEDAGHMQDFLKANQEAVNLTGKLSLNEFIAFINQCDGLVAASTGPLHIAAALGKKAIGLFSPKRPIHPGRWMPLGKDAHVLVFDEKCAKCGNKQDCDCITKINPQQIVDLVLQKENERL